LRRSPAFALAVVSTLALGLGPTLVVANYVQRVILAPLPFPDADQLVRVWNGRPERRPSELPLSLPDFIDYRSGQTAFSALAAHTGTSVAMIIGGTPRQVRGVLTSAELHQVLGVHPVLGRGLVPSDCAPGAPPVMLIGTTLWRNEFGGRSDIVGEVVQVDGQATTIVGVLPDGFTFPQGTHNAWLPLTVDPANANRGSHFLTATGRLAGGTSPRQAEEALNAIARGLAAQHPDTNSGLMVEVLGLKEQLNGDAPRLLAVLSGAIAAVLLIACLNVASLLTVRATIRGGELAVRTALGATARRLRRQLVVEHVVLTVAGGVVAIGLGLLLHRTIVERGVLRLPASASTMGWPAFALLAMTVVAIGAFFAWVTVRRSAGRSAAASLLGSLRQTGSRRLVRARQALVVGEVAAALVLLVVGGLMMRSAARLAAVHPGFRTEAVLTFGVVLPMGGYATPADRVRFADRVSEGLRALPGVRETAVGAYAPMGEMRSTRRFAPADRPLPPSGSEPVALDLPVGPGYFEVLGTGLVEGRTFTHRDVAEAPPVMVVSEEFARVNFPGQRAVGQRVRFYSARSGGTPPPMREIIGVVRDVRQDGVAKAPIMQMYAPYAQTPWSFLSFFIRVDGDPMQYAPLVQRVVSNVDPTRPARDVLSTAALVRSSTEQQRAITWVLIALACAALLMATIGLYGVSATISTSRSRELAIRAAIGAQRGSLLGLLVGQGLLTGAVGVLLGLVASIAATQGLGVLLYETPANDPVTFGLTGSLLMIVATLAAYLPARRALAQNPAEVLRTE
jgi:putative ABC transport system permease protein